MSECSPLQTRSSVPKRLLLRHPIHLNGPYRRAIMPSSLEGGQESEALFQCQVAQCSLLAFYIRLHVPHNLRFLNEDRRRVLGDLSGACFAAFVGLSPNLFDGSTALPGSDDCEDLREE